jgi:hypothetical protein
MRPRDGDQGVLFGASDRTRRVPEVELIEPERMEPLALRES